MIAKREFAKNMKEGYKKIVTWDTQQCKFENKNGNLFFPTTRNEFLFENDVLVVQQGFYCNKRIAPGKIWEKLALELAEVSTDKY